MSQDLSNDPVLPSRSRLLGGRLRIGFLGRDAPTSRAAALATLAPAPSTVAYVHPTHSTEVIVAKEGHCGVGDGLWTTRRDLVLSLETADCVPLVIADANRLALVHAGWRGIVGGIVPEAVRALGNPASLTAWSGPAIRGCCYEVGEDVAASLVEVSDSSVLAELSSGTLRVDLVDAVRVQLRASGVDAVHDCSPCTCCNDRLFWSFRRDAGKAGRNHTFAWLSDAGEESA